MFIEILLSFLRSFSKSIKSLPFPSHKQLRFSSSSKSSSLFPQTGQSVNSAVSMYELSFTLLEILETKNRSADLSIPICRDTLLSSESSDHIFSIGISLTLASLISWIGPYMSIQFLSFLTDDRISSKSKYSDKSICSLDTTKPLVTGHTNCPEPTLHEIGYYAGSCQSNRIIDALLHWQMA